MQGASGGVDGNQKWAAGPVSGVKTRKTRGPAESLPKILMCKRDCKKRIATTDNVLNVLNMLNTLRCGGEQEQALGSASST